MNWILGLDAETKDFVIMWLHGPAGSGKSAIAQTIAERLFDLKMLLASYFFARLDSTRNHPRSLIATIAYQIATDRFLPPTVRERISAAIDLDPLVFTQSLESQIKLLIVEPLQPLIEPGYFAAHRSMYVVIIDGLDECTDRDGQVDILCSISAVIQKHQLPILFLISSRPEHDIKHAFGSIWLRDISTRLALDDDYSADSDIELFLLDEFKEIKDTHPFRQQIPFNWPTNEVMQHLVQKSSGQFIYAATVIKFVKSLRNRPNRQLDIILGLRSPASNLPFAELDALYQHIFSSVESEKLETVLQILALTMLTGPVLPLEVISMAKIEEILFLDEGDVQLLLCDLGSILYFDDFPDNIKFHHASIQDFLLDRSRSGQFHIDPSVYHSILACKLFQYFKGMRWFWFWPMTGLHD